jgi:hypothetical protein
VPNVPLIVAFGKENHWVIRETSGYNRLLFVAFLINCHDSSINYSDFCIVATRDLIRTDEYGRKSGRV